jgi:predicted permease
VLICGQVALSFLLLAAAGLFARSLYKVMTVDSGIETSRLLTFSIDPSLHNYTPERARRLFLDLQSSLARLPGVQAASAVSFAVLTNNVWQNGMHIEGYHPSSGEEMDPGYNETLPGFFSAAGVRWIAGRDFNDRDSAGAPGIVIVNETFQKRFFPHQSPLGHRIGWGDSGPADMEIVGVVKDMKYGDLKEKPRPWTFTPVLQNTKPGAATFYVRTARSPLAAAQAVRQALRSLDRSVPIYDLKTLDTQIGETHFLDRLLAWLSVAFGFLATMLASVGLYGITAFSVARRTQEIGIRMALGATMSIVQLSVLAKTLRLALIGIAAGAAVSLLVSRAIAALLFNTAPTDPIAFAATILLIGSVALLAGYIPARRASRINPMVALRNN